MSNQGVEDRADKEVKIIMEQSSSRPDSAGPSGVHSSPGSSKSDSKDPQNLYGPFHRPQNPLSNPNDLVSISSNHQSEKLKRKNLRKIQDSLVSDAAIDAQQQEKERLDRLALKRPAAPSIANYLPVQTDVIEISDDSESDDDTPECLGVFYKAQIPNKKFSNSEPLSKYSRSDISRVTDRKVAQARQEEQIRLARQSKKKKNDPESVERNAQGRLLINHDRPEEDPDVFVADHLTDILKPHQLGGIRFLYDNIIETVKDFKNSPGFGCVLAHSMGLGKTLQIIEFVDVFLRTVDAKYVLIITPVNVIQNWLAEFDKWLPINDGNGRNLRNFRVFLLGDAVKAFDERKDLIMKWREQGGVLLMGYDMFRIFVMKQTNKKPVQTSRKVLQSAVAEEIDNEVCQDLKKALLDPGPDLVICDEGHKIKCLKTSISNALNQVRTRRRIVLTGYPLQNNLVEYYCMVNFVRPNFLGTKGEFSAMFDRPIRNGQCLDSTPADVKRAQMKIHALVQMLKGFVQRRSSLLLKKILPENKEYVIVVRKTSMQHELYRAFVLFAKVDMYSKKLNTYNPLKAHAIGTKIWNHPDLLYLAYMKKMADQPVNSFFNRNFQGNNCQSNISDAAEKLRLLHTDHNDYFKVFDVERGSNQNEFVEEEEDISVELTYEWAGPIFKSYSPMVMENSNKIVIALEIIKETIKIGEKILLFSSSVLTLNLIERFLTSECVPKMTNSEGKLIKWSKNSSYCRFDGSTPACEREKLIEKFNNESKFHLFLISTKAGSLGINLVSANRVIIMDASWNPCHDAQAVCRVYRYGQQKKTYVYRLIMYNSMEQAIFYRQISKHGLQQRVVDEVQCAAKVTTKQLEDLLKYDEALDIVSGEQKMEDWEFDDCVLNGVIKNYGKLIAEKPFLHDSMITETEYSLSEEEKLEAELLYQQESAIHARNDGAERVSGSKIYNAEFEARLRELQYQNGSLKGSLSDLRNADYSDIGLNRTQFQIAPGSSTQHMQHSFSSPNFERSLVHPIRGTNGTLYKISNNTVMKEPQPTFGITYIQEDIKLKTTTNKMEMLKKGEHVRVMKMSGKTYLRRVEGGEILDATGTKYDPRMNKCNEVIQID